MTVSSVARTRSRTLAPHAAHAADPLPPAHLTRAADVAIRLALALMPFSAIAWTFIAH